jgi:hypothetical protein
MHMMLYHQQYIVYASQILLESVRNCEYPHTHTHTHPRTHTTRHTNREEGVGDKCGTFPTAGPAFQDCVRQMSRLPGVDHTVGSFRAAAARYKASRSLASCFPTTQETCGHMSLHMHTHVIPHANIFSSNVQHRQPSSAHMPTPHAIAYHRACRDMSMT